MGKFEKHMGKPEEIIIEYANGEKETLNLLPLGFEYINDLMLITKAFSSGDMEDPTKIFSNLDEITINRMKKVVMETFKISYPDEPEAEIKSYVARNFLLLAPEILALNFDVGSTEKMEKIRERLKHVRKVPGNQNPQ